MSRFRSERAAGIFSGSDVRFRPLIFVLSEGRVGRGVRNRGERFEFRNVLSGTHERYEGFGRRISDRRVFFGKIPSERFGDGV